MLPSYFDTAAPVGSYSDFSICERFWGWVQELVNHWVERIRGRLLNLEQKEPLVWHREEYRMAYWIVGMAAGEEVHVLVPEGLNDPFLRAHWRMYGQSPENLTLKIEAHRSWMFRNELPPKKRPNRLTAIPGTRSNLSAIP